MVKYYVWFVGEDPDSLEDCWSYDTWKNSHSEAAEQYLDYCHDNMDGWEWMRNDNGKTVVRVMQKGDNTHKDFHFSIDYEPSFTAYEKTE